jgi:hypothetical protein
MASISVVVRVEGGALEVQNLEREHWNCAPSKMGGGNRAGQGRTVASAGVLGDRLSG